MGAQRVRFGEFEFDPTALELYRGQERLPVRGKPLLVLAALVERPSDLLTREELRARLWSGDLHVDFESNLNAAVRKLREALKDSVVRPTLIETLPGRGYRFIGNLEAMEPESDPDRPASARDRLRRLSMWLVPAAVSLVLGGIFVFLDFAGPQRVMVTVLPFRNLSGDSAQNYVAEGLRAELTVQLSSISDGRVNLVAPVLDPSSADFVVTGSTRRDGTGLYVTASLASKEGEQIWGESFVCSRQDLFAIQRQVATKIRQRLLAELSAGLVKRDGELVLR